MPESGPAAASEGRRRRRSDVCQWFHLRPVHKAPQKSFDVRNRQWLASLCLLFSNGVERAFRPAFRDLVELVGSRLGIEAEKTTGAQVRQALHKRINQV